MKLPIALLALLIAGCGKSSDGSNAIPTAPSTPTAPVVPTSPAGQVDGGQWGQRASLLEANSELAFAEVSGKLYLLGGYPANRQTARTVQVYDIASGTWQLGPQLPEPNNHGMAAG
ncbi:MAG TPA: kelch repeat-containing protein, partial [Vicinamibacterales bacterium]|nr:kelch repeat-containing protein [Vicinamibacterales bacterium]